MRDHSQISSPAVLSMETGDAVVMSIAGHQRPNGSNIKMGPPGDGGLCSVPLGTAKISPGRRLTVRSCACRTRLRRLAAVDAEYTLREFGCRRLNTTWEPR
ncbi:MAG TPA: hypothetical protein VGD83_31940 [Streptosporangiaceae bacterium]